MDWEKHAEALSQTLIIPVHETTKRISPSPIILSVDSIREEDNDAFGRLKTNVISSRQRTVRQSYVNHAGPTIFPSLDTFINDTLGQRNSLTGSIRAWTIESAKFARAENGNNNDHTLSQSNIIYQMKGNRWCENISRSHKSNNIMWNVSLSDGTYWQSCHDPECRMTMFRGQCHKVPSQVYADVRNVLLEKQMECDDEFKKALQNLDENTLYSDSQINRATPMKSLNDEHFHDDDFDFALVAAISNDPKQFP